MRSAARLRQIEKRAGILAAGICPHKVVIKRGEPAPTDSPSICNSCRLPQIEILVTRQARDATKVTPKKRAIGTH